METEGFRVRSTQNYVLSDRLLSVLLTLVLLGSLAAVASPGTAQSTGEINLTIQPTSADLTPGETQTYEVVVEGPDTGINGYEQVVVDVADPSVANISSYEITGSGTNGPIDSSAIQNNGATLNLSAALLDAAFGPASETTIATFDVEAVGSAGQSTSLSFDEQNAFQDVTNNSDTIYTVNSFDGATLSISEPPTSSLSDLDVAGQGAAATITQGDNESIAANLTNTGGQTGTFTASLTVGATVSETQQVTNVAPDESREITFENVTGTLGPGDHDVAVSTADDTLQGNLSVTEPSNANLSDIDVGGQGANASITEGDDESIAANVTNVGGETGTFDVSLTVGTTVSETQQVTNVAPGETRTVTFENVTGTLGPDDYDVAISIGGQSLQGNLSVNEPSNASLSDLDVAGQGADAAITEGDNESIAVNVTNVGDETGTFDVSLTVGTAVSETQQVTNVAPDETRTVTFGNVTGTFEPGDYDVTVSTANDSIQGNLSVNEPSNASLADLDIGGQGADATITEGDDDGIAANVTNVGGVMATFDVSLTIGTTVSETQQVTNVAPGETRTVTFGNVTGTFGPGDYDVTVSTANDTVQGNLTVNEPSNVSLADLDIGGQGADATIVVGDNESIAVTLANVGGEAGTFDVSLSIGGTVSETRQVTNLSAGENQTVSFSGVTDALSVGDYQVTAAAGASAVAGNLTVEEAVFVDSYSLSATDLRVDQTLTANATVQNDGANNATLSVPLVVDGQTVDSATVNVTGESNETATLSWDPTYGTASVTVDDLVPTNVTVVGPDLTGDGDGALDTTGDGLLNDVNGDGDYGVIDVQILYENLGTSLLQDYAALFSFQEVDGEPVDIFDVQALFDGIGSDGAPDPTFDMDYNSSAQEVTFIVSNGDSFDAGQVSVHGHKIADSHNVSLDSDVYFGEDITVTAGDSFTVDLDPEGDSDTDDFELQLVWESPDDNSTQIIMELSGPDAM